MRSLAKRSLRWSTDDAHLKEDFGRTAILDGVMLTFKEVTYELSAMQAAGLKALTKVNGQSYKEYIQGVTEVPISSYVKVLDIVDNLGDNPSEKQKERYLEVFPNILEASYEY